MFYKFLALGREEILEPLSALGFEVRDSRNFKEVKEILENIQLEEYHFLLITEDIIDIPPSELAKFSSRLPIPLLILPTPTSQKKLGRELLGRLVRENLGIELWKEKSP